MNNRIIIIILVCALLPLATYAQLTDLGRIEYTHFPQKDSDNSFRRFRILANLPIKLNDKGSYLVPGAEFRTVTFEHEDRIATNFDPLGNFKSYEISLGYTFKMNENWRFAAKVGTMFSSNFENKKLLHDDLLYSGAIFFIKDRKNEEKPWRLILGLRYSTTAGRPFPLPFINYYKKFNPSWSYGLGVPKTNLKYHFNEKNIIQSFVTLDGFFANIQNNRTISNSNTGVQETADGFSMTIVLAGLGYEYYITDHLLFYTYAGYTVLNDIRLRDSNQKDVYTINNNNSIYFRGGLKFKL